MDTIKNQHFSGTSLKDIINSQNITVHQSIISVNNGLQVSEPFTSVAAEIEMVVKREFDKVKLLANK